MRRSHQNILTFLLIPAVLIGMLPFAHAAGEEPAPCTEDAMLVFDRSGSMSGNGWGYGSENPTAVSRIDRVRAALTKILPHVTRLCRVGLITYGPGPYQQCNVKLEFGPTEKAAASIMAVIDGLTPAGQTPLTSAVQQAAEVLRFREKPGVVGAHRWRGNLRRPALRAWQGASA